MSTREFAGRTVLITGGGGGIGYATAELMTERGATVVALGPDDPGLVRVAGLPGVTAVPGDAADEDDAHRAVDAALRNGGRLDAVVCCAGIGTFGTALDPEPGWQDTLRANLDTAYVTTRQALPGLIDTGGAVVLVSSLAGTLAVPGAVAYTTSKHALIGLTRSLAADFGPLGVRANVVCPGAVRTSMLDRVMDELGSRSGLDRDAAYRRAGSLVPLRRAAEPAEIAEVVAFLAGPRSAVVTGAVLMADCGVSAVDLSMAPLTPNMS
ncbi:SDR family NAD(P)-dependent oxidoreductase [Streptomyces fuscichromogenes]|uniref:3-oxoacyl-ACP reductase n=1 Tax=Streptomyces fuscichromogenes TaxID=1324013 RepID=A0A917XGK4_9ACTN|nr:SDR family oxidoreductase [Streptomyces fuscichromogenes]GGN22849.1 3-oxoacyl-ACP reductase [Streptomyces fuscichromogenes]